MDNLEFELLNKQKELLLNKCASLFINGVVSVPTNEKNGTFEWRKKSERDEYSNKIELLKLIDYEINKMESKRD